MRRILFVLGAPYLPGSITGANVSVHALCRRLKADGFDPLVVCAADAAPAGPAAAMLGYTVLRLADPIAAMIEIMERLAPEATVVYGAPTAARALEATASAPRRLHFYFTTTFYGFPEPKPESAEFVRYAVNSRYLEIFGRAYLGLAPALVPPLFEPADYRCEPRGDAILFVNPIAAKGINLVAAIARRLPHRRFLIARSWQNQAAFPHVAVSAPNVEFLPNAHDMRPIYARARLVLMPTIMEEGWGRTVSEAQISGIPAIVSDRGGLPDTVGPGGVVVPLAEPVERWCREVESLFDEARHSALSAAARQHAERPELAPATVMARFLDFLGS